MNKKIFSVILLVVFMTAIFCGCDENPSERSVESSPVSDEVTELASSEFIRINIEEHSNLSYNSSTGVVYYLARASEYSFVPVPLYSPNGYLYRYDPGTGTIEEIVH